MTVEFDSRGKERDFKVSLANMVRSGRRWVSSRNRDGRVSSREVLQFSFCRRADAGHAPGRIIRRIVGSDARGSSGPSHRETVHIQTCQSDSRRHISHRKNQFLRGQAQDQPGRLSIQKGVNMNRLPILALLLFFISCSSAPDTTTSLYDGPEVADSFQDPGAKILQAEVYHYQ